MLFMGLLGDQDGGGGGGGGGGGVWGRGVVSSVLGIMRKRCGYCCFTFVIF